jgi:hypothetical protein
MTLEWVMGWWNLVFIAPFLVALVYLGVYTMTGLTFGEADADADAGGHFGGDAHAEVDVDADAHVGVDADADADVDADAHVDVDADADHDAEVPAGNGHGSFYAMALSWLGVGRVPLSLILMVFMLTWGAVGFGTNAALRERERGAGGWEAARVSIPVALLVSLLVTRAMVMLLGRFVPLNETSARPLRALVGTIGEAVYRIDESFGMAAVRDANGDFKQVACRVGDGVAAIDKGSRVKLVAYDENARMFYVAAVDGASVVKTGGGL